MLLSEIAILCRLARLTLDAGGDPLETFEGDYHTIRDRIARIVPGFHDFNARVTRPGGFQLPNPVNEGVFNTEVGKALFTRNESVVPRRPKVICCCRHCVRTTSGTPSPTPTTIATAASTAAATSSSSTRPT